MLKIEDRKTQSMLVHEKEAITDRSAKLPERI